MLWSRRPSCISQLTADRAKRRSEGSERRLPRLLRNRVGYRDRASPQRPPVYLAPRSASVVLGDTSPRACIMVRGSPGRRCVAGDRYWPSEGSGVPGRRACPACPVRPWRRRRAAGPPVRTGVEGRKGLLKSGKSGRGRPQPGRMLATGGIFGHRERSRPHGGYVRSTAGIEPETTVPWGLEEIVTVPPTAAARSAMFCSPPLTAPVCAARSKPGPSS